MHLVSGFGDTNSKYFVYSSILFVFSSCASIHFVLACFYIYVYIKRYDSIYVLTRDALLVGIYVCFVGGYPTSKSYLASIICQFCWHPNKKNCFFCQQMDGKFIDIFCQDVGNE